MVKNPFWPGTEDIPQAKIDEVDFVCLDETASFAEYEAGNMDSHGCPAGRYGPRQGRSGLSKEFVSRA